MIRLLLDLWARRNPTPCSKPGCPTGIHYHWGYGQRHTSLTPVRGPNSFSDGRPYIKED